MRNHIAGNRKLNCCDGEGNPAPEPEGSISQRKRRKPRPGEQDRVWALSKTSRFKADVINTIFAASEKQNSFIKSPYFVFDCDIAELLRAYVRVRAQIVSWSVSPAQVGSQVSGWLGAACPRAIPGSLPPSLVIYSEERPQRLCAAENCHRRNLSPRRAEQPSRPPPPTEATEYFDLSSAAILTFTT